MSKRLNDSQAAASNKRSQATDPARARMSGAVLIAVGLHAGLAVYAYHHPPPLGPRKTGPITVDVVIRKPAPPPEPVKPPEVTPPPPVPEKPQVAARTETPTRLPKELQPVQRPENVSAGSSAIDFIAQGAGDGKQEVRLLEHLLGIREARPGRGRVDISLYLLDISQPLLSEAYRHASATLAGRSGVTVWAV